MFSILVIFIFFILAIRIFNELKNNEKINDELIKNDTHYSAQSDQTEQNTIENSDSDSDSDSDNNINNIEHHLPKFNIEIDCEVMHWNRPELGIGKVLALHDNDKCTVKFNNSQFSGVPTNKFGDPKLVLDHYDKIRREKIELEKAKENLIRIQNEEKQRLINIKKNQHPLNKFEQLKLAHDNFLRRIGRRNLGLRKSTKIHRVTHCYACKKHLDNSIDLECVACGWIICNCGACGCGWHGYF